MPEAHATWVIGAGGMLGRALTAQLAGTGIEPAVVRNIPWWDPPASVETLARAAALLTGDHRELDVFWCAGAGVVATGPEDLAAEVRVFTAFLDRLGRHAHDAGCRLRLLLSSSAGGVYAGSAGAPFTEAHQPRPLSPYGEAKLAMEQAARAFAVRTGATVLITRISNLYGPGQRLDKPQGLISQLCRAQIERRPLPIYVPLDTARDYVYVADAARTLAMAMERLHAQPAGATYTKLVCCGRTATIGELIGELGHITKHRVPIALGLSPHARFQSFDLRFRSEMWSDLDSMGRTSLPVGMHATYQAVAAAVHALPRAA